MHFAFSRYRLKKADYLIAVKNNQKILYEEIENLFTITKPASEHLSHDIDHGRAEIRKCQVINDLTFLDERKRWEDLHGVCKSRNRNHRKGISKNTRGNLGTTSLVASLKLKTRMP